MVVSRILRILVVRAEGLNMKQIELLVARFPDCVFECNSSIPPSKGTDSHKWWSYYKGYAPDVIIVPSMSYQTPFAFFPATQFLTFDEGGAITCLGSANE